MQDFHAFAGPYLEILTRPGEYPGWLEGRDAEYEPVYYGGRLHWMNGRGDPRPVTIGGRQVWQHCGFPEREEPRCPRWPMYFFMQFATSGDNAVVNLRGVDAAAEVAWFAEAFAPELELVRLAAPVFGYEYAIRWGMVCYVY
jgi:hypothetical protein